MSLKGLSRAEREVLTGFLGRDVTLAERLTLDVAEVDRILRESCFAVGLEEFLPEYFGEPFRRGEGFARCTLFFRPTAYLPRRLCLMPRRLWKGFRELRWFVFPSSPQTARETLMRSTPIPQRVVSFSKGSRFSWGLKRLRLSTAPTPKENSCGEPASSMTTFPPTSW